MAINNVINAEERVLFFAYLSATTGVVTGDGTALYVPWNSKLYDLGGNFDTGSYLFTAPKTGKYCFVTNVRFGSLNASYTESRIDILQVGGKTYNGGYLNIGAIRQSGEASVYNTAIISLTASDTVAINTYVSGGAKNVTIVSAGASNPLSWFCGFLIN